MRVRDPRRTVAVMEAITEKPEAKIASGRWSRLVAALYDPMLWVGETAGLRARRRELLRQARGRTLELGSGTGLNVPHYPDDLAELILTEPAAPMRKRLKKTVRAHDCSATVLDVPAERLRVADASIDTVVATLLLCTVDEPHVVLAEIRRVLKPDGRLLFLEHVRAESPRLAAWQDRLETPWRRFADGCRCNRATIELIESVGFTIEHRSDAAWRAMPRIVRPIVSGSARPDASFSRGLRQDG
jgi:ubiquinone/menaquinone biosynthesis C-methylase UbiE